MEFKYIKRAINESASSFEMEDSLDFLKDGENKRTILKNNPFIKGVYDIFQIFVCDNNKIIASGFHFPTNLILDSKGYQSITCSTLSVNNDYRRQGIGSKIHKLRMEYADNGAILIGSVSQMQYSIMEKLGAKLFFSPRLILLQKSRSVVEMFSKGIIAKVLTCLCDILLWLQRLFIKIIALINKKSCYEIIEVKNIGCEYEDIWKCNNDRFKENHNMQWITWVLQSNNHCKLYYINKKGKTLGWFVLKDEFHKQASQRGFKNVTLRSIIEWESVDIKELSYFKICLFAMSMSGEFDAIELVPFNNSLCKKMKLIGMVPMGKGNIVLRLSDNSPLREIDGIFEEKNWRLRPAAGDNMLF